MFGRERECTLEPKNLPGLQESATLYQRLRRQIHQQKGEAHGGDIGGNAKAQTGILSVCFICTPPTDPKGFKAALGHHLVTLGTLVKSENTQDHELDHIHEIVRRSRWTSET